MFLPTLEPCFTSGVTEMSSLILPFVVWSDLLTEMVLSIRCTFFKKVEPTEQFASVDSEWHNFDFCVLIAGLTGTAQALSSSLCYLFLLPFLSCTFGVQCCSEVEFKLRSMGPSVVTLLSESCAQKSLCRLVRRKEERVHTPTPQSQ